MPPSSTTAAWASPPASSRPPAPAAPAPRREDVPPSPDRLSERRREGASVGDGHGFVELPLAHVGAGRASLPPPAVPPHPAVSSRPHRLAAAALALGLIALSGAGAYLWFTTAPGATGAATPAAAAPRTGTFVLSSHPPGAQVVVDGVPAGVTPLALQLTAGPHAVVATGADGMAEQLSAEVAAGESVSRHLVLQPAAGAPVAAARAPGAPSGIESGPGATPAPVAPPPSYVTFSAPFDVQVYEGGTFLGTSSGDRLRVRPGTHTFALVNEPLGFRVYDTVVVGTGRTVRRVVEPRSALLSVNALPWAEVSIAGRSFGETPLANISLPIGTYRVTLRHPTLGEREVPVTVRLGAPNRLAVDLRR